MVKKPTVSKNFAQMSCIARDLYLRLGEIDTSTLSQKERFILQETIVKSKELFQQMESFITNEVSDLEDTEEKLKENFRQLLGKVAEQLAKVSESTEIAVSSVLNRIENICQRQNEVFNQIKQLREKLDDKQVNPSLETVLEFTEKLEKLENEIQTEAFEIMNEMQFQDITTQQLQMANHLIEEVKLKLLDFRQALSLLTVGKQEEKIPISAQTQVFDPDATLKNREERQQLADKTASEFKSGETS